MGEAIMESSFVQNILLCLQTFMTTVVLFMILGPIAFILGELFPRKWVRYNRFPFNEFSFEKDGSFYRRLRINEWKDRVPDMSILFKWMLPKHAIPQSRSSEYFRRFVTETCVAEEVHVPVSDDCGLLRILFRISQRVGLYCVHAVRAGQSAVCADSALQPAAF